MHVLLDTYCNPGPHIHWLTKTYIDSDCIQGRGCRRKMVCSNWATFWQLAWKGATFYNFWQILRNFWATFRDFSATFEDILSDLSTGLVDAMCGVSEMPRFSSEAAVLGTFTGIWSMVLSQAYFPIKQGNITCKSKYCSSTRNQRNSQRSPLHVTYYFTG